MFERFQHFVMEEANLLGGTAGGGGGASEGDKGGAGSEGDKGAGGGDKGEAGSGGETNWRDAISEDIRNDPSLQVFNSLDDFAKGHISARKLIGQKGIFKPGKDAPESEIATYLNNFRDPDIEKYEVNKGESKVDEDFFKAFKAAAHKAGLSSSQANDIFQFQENMISDAQTKFNERSEATQVEQIKGLRSEWGNDFENRLERANEAMEVFGKSAGVDIVAYLKEIGMSNDIKLVKYFDAVGKGMLEDRTNLNLPPTSLGISVDQANEEYNKNMADTDGAYWNSDNPDHKRIVERMGILTKVMSSASAS